MANYQSAYLSPLIVESFHSKKSTARSYSNRWVFSPL